jgi:hypothetical protein
MYNFCDFQKMETGLTRVFSKLKIIGFGFRCEDCALQKDIWWPPLHMELILYLKSNSVERFSFLQIFLTQWRQFEVSVAETLWCLDLK